MSFHADPITPAERLARHLEMNYGLQLDAARHQALCAEIEGFLPVAETAPDESPVPEAKSAKKRKGAAYAER